MIHHVCPLWRKLRAGPSLEVIDFQSTTNKMMNRGKARGGGGVV